LPRYRRADLRPDLVAGVTVAALMIPQSMAYVHVAGFPPVVGLYCSVVPLLVYAVFGNSRTLAIGPVASISLITAAGIAGVADTGSYEYVELAATLALLSGALAVGLGAGRLGFLMSFLSDPVLTGFIGGVGVIILVTQIESMAGLPVATSTQVVGELPRLVRELGDVSWPDLAFGLGTVALMLITRRWRRFPSALVAVVGAMVVVWAFDLAADVDVVGAVASGLAPPQVPVLDLDLVGALLPTAVAVTIIGFIETMALDKTGSNAPGARLDANDELIAFGATNVSAGFFQAIPVLGVPTRTAVAIRAGARSQLTGVVAAATALVVLLVATDLFRYLPVSALAGVVLVAAFGFFKVAKAREIWATKRADFWLGMITFVATPTLGLEWGIAIGGILSLVVVVYRVAHPHLTVLGRQPGTDAFRAIERHGGLETHDGVLIVRIDAPLFYANASFVTDHVESLTSAAAAPVRALVLDFSGVDDLDATAATALHRLIDDLRVADIDVYLANVRDGVRDVLEGAGLISVVGPERFFATDYDAELTLEHDGLGAREARPGGSPIEQAEADQG
jgi:SulP family sulfate permease